MQNRNIRCQHCNETLAHVKINEEGGKEVSYKPSEVQGFSQELDKDSSLITFQCPKCGCMLQIKI